MSDSVRPHRRQPTRLCRPWDSSGKNTGVGCHFHLQCMKVKSEKWSCSVVSDPQQPHGLQPSRLLRPWDFPGKSTGVECHCLLPASESTKQSYILTEQRCNGSQQRKNQLAQRSDVVNSKAATCFSYIPTTLTNACPGAQWISDMGTWQQALAQ